MAESIILWFESFLGVNAGKIIGTMIISLLPIIELRGAIPVACVMGLPWYVAFLCAVIGNILPVPFILLFVDKVFAFMKKHNILIKFVNKLESKAVANSAKVERYAFWGLCIFVAIPLPGTGAWTGALIASMLKMHKRIAFISITLGVLIAGVLVTVAVYGSSYIYTWISSFL